MTNQLITLTGSDVLKKYQFKSGVLINFKADLYFLNDGKCYVTARRKSSGIKHIFKNPVVFGFSTAICGSTPFRLCLVDPGSDLVTCKKCLKIREAM